MKTIMLGCGMIGAWEHFAKYREFFVDITSSIMTVMTENRSSYF